MWLPSLLLAALQQPLLAPQAPSVASYGPHHTPVEHDPASLNRYFSEPAMKLHAPFFTDGAANASAWAAGLAGPTDEYQLDAFLRELDAKHGWATYATLNETSEEGRPLRYVKASSGQAADSRDKLRIWIQGGAHGNEPGGDQGALALLGLLAHDPEYAQRVLEKIDLLVLPRYNPDGVSYFTRTLATGFDPNRDHLKLSRSQTVHIKALLNGFNPHIAIDAHEYSASRYYGSERWGVGSDGLFAAAKHLNIDAEIRNISEHLFSENIARDLAMHNYTGDAYMTGSYASHPDGIAFKEADSDAKIGRNSIGLTQTISFLLETRGIGLGSQHFPRRVGTMLAMLTSIVDTAVTHADEVRVVVERGRAKWRSGKGEIVLKDRPRAGTRSFLMCNAGKGVCEDKEVEWLFTTPTVPVLTRARPAAYIIPGGWAEPIVTKLRALGLEVETLNSPYAKEVETLKITHLTLSGTYYEGAVNVAVETTLQRQNVSLPAGSFRVPSEQQKFALAVAALEPEGIDSFASFNIIPLAVGETYPIFRELFQ